MVVNHSTVSSDESAERCGVTRAQLMGYGASRYQATQITKTLAPTGKSDRSYTYDLREVIAAVRAYAERPRIRPDTRKCLDNLLKQLTPQLDNLATFVGRASDSETSHLAKNLLKTMQRKEKQLAELEAIAATRRGKRKSRQMRTKEVR